MKKILKLKKEKNAIILAHNYQRPEIQDIADYLGDSLGLSLHASETDAKIIVFCGVTFMAETAALLNPDKTVLIPDRNALCPLAGMLPAELARMYREKHPEANMVLYVNTLAEAKAECDAVCTSANSVETVNRMKSDTVLFGPDANLARYTAKFTAKHLIPVPRSGFCPVHKLFSKDDVLELKKRYPEAEVLVHPECDPEVCDIADLVGSTAKMSDWVKKSNADKFIVATEIGMLHRLKKDREDAVYIPAYNQAVCVNMKMHTLEKLYLSLKKERYVVNVRPDIATAARKAVDFVLK